MVNIDASQVVHLAVDLEKAPATLGRQVSRVVRKTAHDIEGDAKQLAPVDTGFLKNSIGTDLSTFSATVGPTASYARYVEFGTSRMGPEPYMRPAFDRNADVFVRALRRVTGDFL